MAYVQQNYPIEAYERKLLAGMLFVMLAFLPTLGFAMYCLSTVSRTENQLNFVYTKTLLLAEDLRTAKVQQDAFVPAFILSGDPSLLDRLYMSDHSFDKTISELKAMPLLAPKAETTLTDIVSLQQKLLNVERPGIDMKKAGGTATEVDNYFQKNGIPLIKPILIDLDQFVQENSEAYDKKKSRSNRDINIVFRILAVASSISVFFSGAVITLLVRLMHRKKEYDLISERLAYREKEISTARKEALETVAHDLKNPLCAIMMTAGILQSQSNLSELDRSRAGIISSSAHSMNLLISNLLDHTKIESGSLTLTKENCDIGSTLTRLISRFEILAITKDLKIIDETLAIHKPILLDEARIEQVFSNLLGNAIKFTARGGNIRISDVIENNLLVISISDTGTGMTKEQTDHIFERYWQAGETASSGTGLGLAISKAIVDAHYGTISVKSEVGKGSTFCVSLPLASKVQSSAA